MTHIRHSRTSDLLMSKAMSLSGFGAVQPTYLLAAILKTECEARRAMDVQVLVRQHTLGIMLDPSVTFSSSDCIVRLARQAKDQCIRLEHTILRSGHFLLALLQCTDPELSQCFEMLQVNKINTASRVEKILGQPRIPFHTALARFSSDTALQNIVQLVESRSREYKDFLHSKEYLAARNVHKEIDLLLESRDNLLLRLWK